MTEQFIIDPSIAATMMATSVEHDSPSIAATMMAASVEHDWHVENDEADGLSCIRIGCVERPAVDHTGRKLRYCRGTYCGTIGVAPGPQRGRINMHRVVNGNVPNYSPLPVKPGPPNQFVPPPIGQFEQAHCQFEGFSKPRLDSELIDRTLKSDSSNDPLERARLLGEMLQQLMIAPHDKFHPFCNSIRDEFLPPHTASLGPSEQRVCAREGCGHVAYICSDDPSRFGSYCSSNCYWLEVATLDETRVTTLDSNDMDYCRIKNRFESEIPNVKILVIFRLQMPRVLVERFKTYRLCMANHSNRSTTSITHRMFHGTKAACSLLYLSCNGDLCEGNCPMCGIAKSGNRKCFSRRGGKRMWFASTPAISYRYCGDLPTKAMFVVDVVAPKCADIVIVDMDEATLPRFLVLFQ